MWFTIYSYYYDKQDDIDNIFDEKNVPLSTKFDHPAFIEEWGKILILLIMKKIDKGIKLPSKKK